MATLATGNAPPSFSQSQGFFVKLAWVLSILIVFAFAQNAALGRVDIPKVPLWVHLHALAMLAWLALYVNQNRLAAAGNLALHRKLGRLSLVVVCLIIALTGFSGVQAVAMHRQPPFFDPAFFLMMVEIDAVAFGGLIAAGIANRRDTETHRRLMTGATIILADAALGRLVPLPLTGGEAGQWIATGLMLGIVGLIALHDRRTLGRIHAATVWVGAVVLLTRIVMSLAARTQPVIDLAAWVGGA